MSYETLSDYDPTVVSDLIRESEASIAELQRSIQTKSGPELFDFILDDFPQRRKNLSHPQSFGVIMTGMNAASWLNEKMEEWLGEKNAADTLTHSVPNNITSEMGLDLLDVADVIRPYPEVVEYLHHARDEDFWDGLVKVHGGQEARDALTAYLARYGMRGAGRNRHHPNPLERKANHTGPHDSP